MHCSRSGRLAVPFLTPRTSFSAPRRHLQIVGSLGQNTAATAADPPQTGDWAEATQVIDADAVRAFAALTHDHNAIHTSDAAAARAPIASDSAIVHGLLAAAAIPAIFGAAFPGAVYRSQELHFRAPIPVGAAVTTHILVERVRVLRGGRGGALVRCATQCFVDDDGRAGGGANAAIEGIAQVLVPPPAPSEDDDDDDDDDAR